MPRSTSLGAVVLALIFLIGASAPPNGQLSGANQSSNTTAVPNRRVHTVGDVWMSIGSDGRIGGQYDVYGADPDSIAEIESSFEFPGGSQRDHLFGSGLWIGGLVGGVDTLVMAAMLANSGSNPVFTPTQPMQTLYDTELGHQYFVAHYADTAYARERFLTDRSLGVEVRQTSHAFKSRPYDRCVLVEYLIRNISRQTIYKAHVGFFADPDVFHELRTGQPEDGPFDDITGYLRERGIAYTIDNDGDAANVSDSLFSRNWCPSGFGLAPVMMDPLPACTSFNWWATNWGSLYWGPSRTPSNFTSTSPGEPVLPGNMSQMFRAMTNREVDYDQIEAAIDKRDQGWVRPAIAQADHVANGLDTRWALSYCFGNLAPFDSLRIVMAYVIGDSIHTSPGRYPDPYNPDTFVAGLNFTDLRRNVDLARWAWGHKFNLDGAAPAHVTLSPVADDALKCEWTPAPDDHVAGYQPYVRRLPDGDWAMLRETSFEQTSIVAQNLIPGTTYEFSVASLDWNRNEGPRSRSSRITAGLPVVAPVLAARAQNTAVGLNWQIPSSPAGLARPSTLNIYRRTGTQGGFALLAQIPLSTLGGISTGERFGEDKFGMSPFQFTDRSITSGELYLYRVTVTNSIGLEGPLSNEVSAVPMLMDRRGLLILERHYAPGGLVDYERQKEFYSAWASHYGFEIVEVMNYSREFEALMVIGNLSRYQCIVSVSEEQYGNAPLDAFPGSLPRYAKGGGKSVFILRNHGIRDLWWPQYYVNGILTSLCGVSSVHKEPLLAMYSGTSNRLSVEFVGAKSLDTLFSDIEGDSARAWDFDEVRRLALEDSLTGGAGYVPVVGALGRLDSNTQVIYSYRSVHDASFFNGKPIAVKRITDSTAAILFNFPLSLMKHEQAWQALTQAVADLGIDTTNYWLPPTSTTRSMIEWLYGKSAGAPDPAWDINQDGVIDIRDVVEVLDR